jgi:hypothetical protein
MSQESQIIFYTTPQGNINVSVRFVNETFWLTQKQWLRFSIVVQITFHYT